MGAALCAITQSNLSENLRELSGRILSLCIHMQMVHAPKQAVIEKGM